MTVFTNLMLFQSILTKSKQQTKMMDRSFFFEQFFCDCGKKEKFLEIKNVLTVRQIAIFRCMSQLFGTHEKKCLNACVFFFSDAAAFNCCCIY